MIRKHIPIKEAAAERMNDSELVTAYNALEDEFALAMALIKARGGTNTPHEQVAVAMGTSQALIQPETPGEKRRR